MKIPSCFILILILAACGPQSNEVPSIRTNQIGFYPDAVKEFIFTGTEADSFQIINEADEISFKGRVSPMGKWEASGEEVHRADFTPLKSPGTYSIVIGDTESHPFEIKESVYLEALNAATKSFYFQRASMAIEEAYGGIYKRGAGHADLKCTYHPSSGRSEGTLDSPKGWYDAGDYGKYVVNAAISCGQMLNLVELYPEAIRDNQLNIPESGNGVSDLLDEVKYELDWILTMQDQDGGVYHKLTAKKFSGFIMPSEYDLERFVIGKGTASTLNFAAVMAQASRIFQSMDSAYAEKCLSSAKAAWQWSEANPDIRFKNPEDVSTGQYGDIQFLDDFYWAAAELYITTHENQYWDHLVQNEQPVIHQITNSWKYFIRNMGFHSLLANKASIDSSNAQSLMTDQLSLADEILEKLDRIPYHVSIDHFEWGSNSDVLNQAMILCYAHHLTGERRYLDGAQMNVDYIFGKNATGYSFLTGFGTRPAMYPHHRPSGADGIPAPVPGFIIGGPNMDKQDGHQVNYAFNEPARSFEDVEASFASNEVCLNWNAPAVFVLGYLEQVQDKSIMTNLR